MWIFKNRRFIVTLLSDIILIALSFGATFFIDKKASVVIFFFVIVISVRDIIMNYDFYKKLRTLTQQINRLSQNDIMMSLKDYAEGDLSILSSEIYKIVRELKGLTEELTKEKKLLSDALADISHQIKTPLTSIELMLSRILTQDLSEDEKRKLFYEIKIKIQSLEWMILALLKLSKIENKIIKLHFEKISLNNLISKVISDDLGVIAEFKKINFITDSSAEYFVQGDKQWISEAFSNIIKNSIEHTPFGSNIKIYIYNSPLYIGVKIEDSGDGFADKDIKYIFDRFYKDENAPDKNIGIGLAISKSIFERHNATVEAYNSNSGGGCFDIKFYKGIL
ncbi:MAG: HAMP domain-containing sensor histidine kinase [Clostridia bacterium]|nr:HAMP domain-containing sensor histidine kinase [Clostridia bacterium]